MPQLKIVVFCLLLYINYFVNSFRFLQTKKYSTILRYNEIVVVGSIAIDLVSYVDNLPKYGETIFGNSFETNFGGKGANQAVQCSQLGIKTTLIGCVGDDDYGEKYINNLLSKGINTKYINRVSGSTGTASINVAKDGGNTIVVIPGANAKLSNALLSKAEIIFSQSKVLLCQNEIPKEVTLNALKIADRNLLISIFNPAPAEKIDSLIELVSACDIVCPNESELSVLTSLPTDCNSNIEIAVKKLLSYGCSIVVVTLGKNGACIGTKDSVEFIPAIKVNAVDTVGAGDSFLGTLGSNLARGDTLRNSVIKGIQVSGISVTRYGAQVSYAALEELEEQQRPKKFDHSY